MTRLNEPIPTESIEPTQPFQGRDFQLNCQLSSNIAQSLVMILAGMIGAGLGIILFPEYAILSSLLGLMIGVITGLIMSGAVIAYISHSVTPVDANHERKFNKARYRYIFSMLIMLALLIGPATKDYLNKLPSGARELISTIYGLFFLPVLFGSLLIAQSCPCGNALAAINHFVVILAASAGLIVTGSPNPAVDDG